MTPETLLNEARTALAAGDYSTAERRSRQALVLAASADAHETLANALRAQDRLEEALAAADRAVECDPRHATAQHARALILSRLGRYKEAVSTFDALVARGVAAAPLWLNRGVALLGQGLADNAEAAFADGVKRWPQDQALHHALASVRWMRGEGETFARDYEAAVARQPDALALRLGCADLLRRAELHVRSETVLRQGLQRTPDNPPIEGALGVVLDEVDRTEEAVPLLTRAINAAPNVAFLRGNLISALLRLGRSEQALREIEPLRAAQPFNGDWIAYQGMAWRQLGDPRYRTLCDYDVMVRAYDLEAPAGYRDMAEFNAALRDSLNRLHVLETHPLDQSLRHGSQTTRSLLTIDDPVIKSYLTMLDEPIRAYIATMQAPDHPWSGRKSDGFKLAGCWSVRLKPKGYHVNHLHPQGWISSAYYVSLPEATRSGAGHEGWIKFGEPRWPTPACSVEKIVQPSEGRLVLFPSYMWHGTIPFSQGERMTAPFDVAPA